MASQGGYEDLWIEHGDQPGHTGPVAGQGGYEDNWLDHGDQPGHLRPVVGQGRYEDLYLEHDKINEFQWEAIKKFMLNCS